MSTRLPAYTLVELVLRFGIDRVELDRLVEHFPRRPPAARRDRPRFAWPADVGEDALDCATRMSAFRGTAAVEILETDVGSGSIAVTEVRENRPAAGTRSGHSTYSGARGLYPDADTAPGAFEFAASVTFLGWHERTIFRRLTISWPWSRLICRRGLPIAIGVDGGQPVPSAGFND